MKVGVTMDTNQINLWYDDLVNKCSAMPLGTATKDRLSSGVSKENAALHRKAFARPVREVIPQTVKEPESNDSLTDIMGIVFK